MDPVVSGALGELIADAVVGSAGWTWSLLKANPQGGAIRAAIDAALADAVSAASLQPGGPAGEAQVAQVKMLRPAFTPEVCMALTGCLAGPFAEAQHRFADVAQAALAEAGCDLEAMRWTFWVEEFLTVLPRRLFDRLCSAALQDRAVDRLVGQLLAQRTEARAARHEAASPGEFRSDLIQMMDVLSARAATGKLPGYLPAGSDAGVLTREVRVRSGVRAGLGARRSDDDACQARRYRLAAERADDSEEPRPWPQVAAEHARLVVLGDPGLGKSWLIRTETLGLAREARNVLDDSPGAAVAVPVPLRCDQLNAALGTDLAAKAAACLVSQGLLAGRSQDLLAAGIRAGRAVLLLDAADELTNEGAAQVRELLREWAETAGAASRCVVTSRIAGYTGSPVPGATEVELQPYSPDEVIRASAAWQLSPSARAGLTDWLRDPAVAAMARIPLTLALLCSLAATAEAGEPLPRTRGELYERVLRWFLTGAHRSPESPAALTRSDIDVEAMLQILAPVAFAFAASPDGWTDLMPGDQILSAIRAAGPAFTEMGRPATDVLRDLSVVAGILVPEADPSAGRASRYLFLHRTFAEYLVARHLAAVPQRRWRAIVEQHRWFDPDWEEVPAMLAGRLSPSGAAALVSLLSSDEPDPFHHSLLTAAQAWAARPDADDLLPAAQQTALADRISELLIDGHARWRTSASRQVREMAYLPAALRAVLLAQLCPGHDPGARRAAAQALAGRDTPEVTRALLDQITARNDASVQTAAIQALASQDTSEVTRALLERLTEATDPGVRYAAAEILASRDTHEVTRALINQFLTDSDSRVVDATAKALASRHTPDVTRALIAQLASGNPGAQPTARRVLAGRDTPEATSALIDQLTSSDNPGVLHAAAEILAGRDTPEVNRAFLSQLTRGINTGLAVKVLHARDTPEVTRGLLDQLTSDEHPATRHLVIQALAGHNTPEATHALLGQLANATGRFVRTAAAKALAGRDAPEVTSALLRQLSDHGDLSIRTAVIEALAGRDNPEVTRALIDELNVATDLGIRHAATQALAGHDNPEVTRALLRQVASNDDPAVRAAAIRALAPWDAPEVTRALLDQLTSSAEVRVSHAATEVLANRHTPEIARVLLDQLTENSDPRLQQVAIRALAGQDAPQVTRALLSQLTETSHPGVRHAAIAALASRDTPEVTRALLKQLTTTTDPGIDRAAEEILTVLDSPQAADVLLDDLATETDSGLWYATMQQLAVEGTLDEARFLLREIVEDYQLSIRLTAIRALASRGTAEVTRALLDRLTSDEDSGVRSAAADALTGRDTPEVTSAMLHQLTSSTDPAARLLALRVLSGRDTPEVIHALLGHITTNNDPHVRAAAATELATSRSPEALLAVAAWAGQHAPAAPPELAATAKALMIRHYLQITPQDRPGLRAAIAQLNAAADTSPHER